VHAGHTGESALAGFEAAVGLVDHIDAATTANHAVVAVAALEGLKRIDDLHRIYPLKSAKLREIEGAPLWGKAIKVKRHCGFLAKRLGLRHEPVPQAPAHPFPTIAFGLRDSDWPCRSNPFQSGR
jgi:hypothetical protein